MTMERQVFRNEKKITPSEAKELSALSVQQVRKLIESSKNSVDDAIKLQKYASLPAVAKHLVLIDELSKVNNFDLQNAINTNPWVGALKAKLWNSHRKTD
ncbi:MAG: hypothetical protein KGH71_05280 [Candidatus Micrarchaeota archaeon]|nr:hypothetical protein [Candidatus Micrarchaeota archaeon]